MNTIFPMNFFEVILYSRRDIFREFATRTQWAVIHSPTTNFRTAVSSSTTQKSKIACSTCRINRRMSQWMCMINFSSAILRYHALGIRHQTTSPISMNMTSKFESSKYYVSLKSCIRYFK